MPIGHPARFEFPAEFAGHTKYPSKPEHLIESFREHVRATGEPESFPGLYWGKIDRHVKFDLLCDFGVDGHKRPNGNRVPCPMCPAENKFLIGALIYIWSLQAIAIIGHECADKAQMKHARLERKAIDDRTANEDFLLENLPLVAARIDAMVRVRPAVVEADRVFHGLKSALPDFQAILRSIFNKGKRLYLTEEVRGEMAVLGARGFSKAEKNEEGVFVSFRDIEFGPLQGGQAFRREWRPLKDLNSIGSLLEPLLGCDTEEQTIERAIALHVRGEHQLAQAAIIRAQKLYQKLQMEMDDFSSFFSRENIDRLQRWSKDPRNPLQFEISMTASLGRQSIRIEPPYGLKGSRDLRYVDLVKADLFQKRPIWPSARH